MLGVRRNENEKDLDEKEVQKGACLYMYGCFIFWRVEINTPL